MTNNNSNSGKSPTFFEPSPLKLVILTALTMLICIMTSAFFIYSYTQNQAIQYTNKQVTIVKNQAKITLQPLILSKDTLSMNVYLKTLSQADFISGMTLLNTKQQVIARAGHSLGNKEIVQIFSQQLAIGELSLFINREPATQFFNQLLWLFLTLSITSAVFTLFIMAYLSKKVLRDFSNQYKPLLEHRFSMELAKAEKPELPPSLNNSPQAENEEQTPTNHIASLAIVNLDHTHTTSENNQTASSNSEEENTNNSTDQIVKSPDQLLENKELVSLLKPDTQKRMPHFKPFTQEGEAVNIQTKDNSAEIELTEVIQTPVVKPSFDITLNEETNNTSQNPLLRKHSQEEQLDLYSLEHQSELNLKACDAAYVLFIDCSSGRAPIEDQEEHNALLTQYRKLVNLVIKIYGGQLELSANGDVRVLFDEQSADDNHGTQALCAAKLFNQLYKYYNHRQITRMQPTLNIQTSLVRGNREKIEILREESHFLTCTTVSNELISHTPLSEVSTLKDSLLDGAITERQDEDKILILKLNPTYQELLEKQARHLAKTF